MHARYNKPLYVSTHCLHSFLESSYFRHPLNIRRSNSINVRQSRKLHPAKTIKSKLLSVARKHTRLAKPCMLSKPTLWSSGTVSGPAGIFSESGSFSYSPAGGKTDTITTLRGNARCSPPNGSWVDAIVSSILLVKASVLSRTALAEHQRSWYKNWLSTTFVHVVTRFLSRRIVLPLACWVREPAFYPWRSTSTIIK